MREINYGVHRFDQIARYTGASRDVLADRLRKLEKAGVVERRRYSQHPPRYEYHATPEAGEQLRPVLLALAQWGNNWALPTPSRTFTHRCGHRLALEHVCSHCNETVTKHSVRMGSV
jgi:DNA-binding HxlR family transcriptional regulator